MRRLFYFIIAMVICTGNALAFELENEPAEGLSWMGIFGMNISKLQNSGYGAKAGATMGIRAEYVLPKAHGTYITAGLDWTMKGGKTSVIYDDGIINADATMKYALHYIEIPIRAGFRYNITEDFGVYGEFGPFFSVGIGGRHRMNIDGDGDAVRLEEEANNFKAFKNYGYPVLSFQRWDAGLGFRIGAEYAHHYNLMIGCDWGLADIFRNSLRDDFFNQTGTRLPKVRNFHFTITLGYRF
ncbi:MAG: outer membrane beta-barrel protein [Bacteroidaceae bacterium]|nr:outer membrane beta-barrel protein [Bacteroidaceae bacterium]